MQEIAIYWFRRDLRVEDNTAFLHALESGLPVLPVFIFDENILKELNTDDARISFIYEQLFKINRQIRFKGSSIKIYKGEPIQIWRKIVSEFSVSKVFTNKDYEPYAIERDKEIVKFLKTKAIDFLTFKDQVMFEEDEIVKTDGKPYTVFTPYKRKWLDKFTDKVIDKQVLKVKGVFFQKMFPFPSLSELGFKKSSISVKDFDLSVLDRYAALRNFPAYDATSYLGVHLRFGTISIRKVLHCLHQKHEVFLSELIWREFFMQILFHFPEVVNNNFKTKYDGIQWRNNEQEFKRWCQGKTGYPLVDAGMRQLNQTGYMHNRVRMVCAGFLCKHLVIDWRWGEAYFASKLLDYELASNNGNWQWAAGTGCDAAPYFRIFNPMEQQKKFDRNFEYIKNWVPEFGNPDYFKPMVEHSFARTRAIGIYKNGIYKCI